MLILATGAAGFIGRRAVLELLAQGHQVTGVDSLNDYYDPQLKKARLSSLADSQGFEFHHLDLSDLKSTRHLFECHRFDAVLHLAARPGVRSSPSQNGDYIRDNLLGFSHVLDLARQAQVGHFVYASSSSVYGARHDPMALCRETDRCDTPLSLYAATKKSNEDMAHAVASQHGLPCTGLRFFTVYGPWGRPDMALSLFADALERKQSLSLHNEGLMTRDFTFIDDVARAIAAVLSKPATALPDSPSQAPSRIFNVGSGQPRPLVDFVRALEASMGIHGAWQNVPMHPSEALGTWADCSSLLEHIGFSPSTSIEEGIDAFVRWRRALHTGDTRHA